MGPCLLLRAKRKRGKKGLWDPEEQRLELKWGKKPLLSEDAKKERFKADFIRGEKKGRGKDRNKHRKDVLEGKRRGRILHLNPQRGREFKRPRTSGKGRGKGKGKGRLSMKVAEKISKTWRVVCWGEGRGKKKDQVIYGSEKEREGGKKKRRWSH